MHKTNVGQTVKNSEASHERPQPGDLVKWGSGPIGVIVSCVNTNFGEILCDVFLSNGCLIECYVRSEDVFMKVSNAVLNDKR